MIDNEYRIVIKNLREYIKKEFVNYVHPDKINEKKEIFLEKNNLINHNLNKLREQVSKLPLIENELNREKENNIQLNIDNKNKEIIINDLKLKLKPEENKSNLLEKDIKIEENKSNLIEKNIKIEENKSDLGVVVDKLNILISKLASNEFPKTNSWTNEDHSKKIYDIDEKLSNLVSKISHPNYFQQPPLPNYFQQPPPNYFQQPPLPNYFQQPPEYFQPITDLNKTNIVDLNSSNPFKKIPLYEEKKEEEHDNKYEELLKKMSLLQEKYEILNNSNSNFKQPIHLTINNNDKESPFKYIYDNTDEFIFEKKPILKGGKLMEYKKIRKLRIT